MDRNREARRVSNMVGSNGFSRRRYGEDVVGPELHETARWRERAKKDRDRERDLRGMNLKERDLRERPRRIMSSGLTRRRNERLRSGGGVTATGYGESSEESVTDDDEDDEVEDSNPTTTNRRRHRRHENDSSHLEHRKGFLLPNNASAASSKAFGVPPPVWRSGDEAITVAVPRKARSSCTKRTHDVIPSSNGGEKNLRQLSDSPATRKKLKPGVDGSGPQLKPPTKAAAANPSSASPEELEIEIAEVLYGLMTQQPSKNEEELLTRESSSTTTTTTAKDLDQQTPKSEILSPLNSEKASPSTGEDGSEAAQPPETESFAGAARDGGESLAARKEILSLEERDCFVVRSEGFINEVSTSLPTSKVKMYLEEGTDKEERFEIDLMAPPPQLGSSPEREAAVLDLKPVLSALNAEPKPVASKDGEQEQNNQNQEKKRKRSNNEEPESLVASSGLKIDSEKPETDSRGQSKSISQPRSKRCVAHGRIASYIYHQQQHRTKTNPFGPNPCNNLSNNVGVSKIPSPSDSYHRKQILTQQQQSLPPIANTLTGPGFIFPMSQQQACNGKSPNMGPGEAQYLAFLQSHGYSFAGPPPAQAVLPVFNGSFYPQQPVPQPQQNPNASNSSSSSSQKQGLESRVPAVNIYGRDFTLVAPPPPSAADFSGSNRNEKKANHSAVVKARVESSAPRGLNVSFGPSTATSSPSMARDSPDATAQQKKIARVSIDATKDDERKGGINAHFQSQVQQHQQQQQFSVNQSKGNVFSEHFKGTPQQISLRSQTPVNAPNISFVGGGNHNHKPSTASPGQACSSPTTSSVSKEAIGSPRTSFSSSRNSKNSSNMLTQQSQKSPSLLGNSPQQLFFLSSPPLVGARSPSNPCGPYYTNHQQKLSDKNTTTFSSGLLSLSPNLTTTMDPSKAIAAAATGNGKSGSLPSQGVFNAVQFGGSGFLHAQPAMARVRRSKPTEQKQQPAGNENLLRNWDPKKK